MRLITWIPIAVLSALAVLAWIAIRSEHPLALAFDEPPPAATLADPVAPLGESQLTGVLVTPEGRPLRDALVQTSVGTRLCWTHSDAEGRFLLSGVTPGEHELTVVARGFRPMVFEAGTADSPLTLEVDLAPPDAPQVPAAERTDLTVTLRAVTAGVDLANYELLLIPRDTDVRAAPTFPRRGEFDAQGRCTIEGLTHGTYRAQVLPAWARGGTWPDLLTDLDGPGEWRAHPAQEPWVLELQSGEIRGRITDRARRPDRRVEFVAGALILVRPAGATGPDLRDPRIWPPAESAEDGGFLVTDLPPGRYVVSVHAGARNVEREVAVYAAATTTLDL